MRTLSQIGQALQFAHDHNIIHLTTTIQKIQQPGNQGCIPIVIQSSALEVYQFSNSYKQTLMREIAGKTLQNARSFLLIQAGIEGVTISLSGRQRDILPQKISQITLNIANPVWFERTFVKVFRLRIPLEDVYNHTCEAVSHNEKSKQRSFGR